MKKVITFIAGTILITSCTTTGTTAFGGAMFGGVIGSAIGGISGGPRGSDFGVLIGAATGAMAGAVIGQAAEAQSRPQVIYATNYSNEPEGNYYSYNGGYSSDGQYDDVVSFNNVPPAQVETTDGSRVTNNYPLRLQNVRLINEAGTSHIAKGELVRISFEIRNASNSAIANIVPMVTETTGNKRMFISPATLVESLPAQTTIRYTAFVSAQTNLKTGTAHFKVYVTSNGATVSDTVEFDVPLN